MPLDAANAGIAEMPAAMASIPAILHSARSSLDAVLVMYIRVLSRSCVLPGAGLTDNMAV